MRKLLFCIIVCLAVFQLVGCSKPEKKAQKSQKLGIETAILKAASVEVSTMFSLIRTNQMAYKAETGEYMECLPSPPDGGTDAVPDVWVDAGGFEEIGFRPEGRIRYQYAVTVSADGRTYEIIATGDLDENGVKAKHTVTSANLMPKKEPVNEY